MRSCASTRATPAPSKTPPQAAALRVIRTAEIEIARLLDGGAGAETIFGLCSSVSASILDTVASSAAVEIVGLGPNPARRAAYLQMMLHQIGRHLTGKDGPAHHDSEIVEDTQIGTA